MAIGTSPPRVDGLDKLSGRARYLDDLTRPGMWHGITVRTPAARGRITGIQFAPHIDWSEFVVVDARDIVGINEVQFIIAEQPVLVPIGGEFRHKHEPVLLLAHPDPEALRAARRAITIEYEPLSALFDPRTPLTPGLVQFGSDNVFKRIHIRKGAGEAPRGLERIFAAAAHVIEGEYHTGAQEHVYIEPNGMLAWTDEEKRLVIQGTMQCPYYVLKGLEHCFNRPPSAFRVMQTPTGGGFGGKEDFPSVIAIHAGLLAEKAGRPIKLVYDRGEDMAVTTKRHPSWVRHRTAVDHDARLLAMEINVVMDGGAYLTLSPVVLSRGVIHAAGPYHCEHISIHGEVRLTNSPPHGAFRGFGAPQTLFAVERQMDAIADKLGMPPEELRARNLLKPGQTTATGQVFADKVDVAALQARALEKADYAQRREAHRVFNTQHAYLRRGIGFATFFHGAGFTGSGETMLASQAWVEALPDGSVEVLTANTDIGQGTETVLAMVACTALELPQGPVRVVRPDTARVPNSGPTVASRTTMVVGKLVETACRDLQKTLARDGVEPKGAALQEAIIKWHQAHPGERLLGRAQYETPASVQWDDVNYRGSAYATYAYATYVADVEVDLRTFGVKVKDFVALQEIGKVVHPLLANGQIQGGVVQGIGWALMEEVVFEQGAMKNAQLTNYIIPTSSDLPPIRVFFEESPNDFGPGGAKGIGELPMDGPAPAVLNAVCAALGRQDLNVIPLTPERLMETMEHTSAHEKAPA